MNKALKPSEYRNIYVLVSVRAAKVEKRDGLLFKMNTHV